MGVPQLVRCRERCDYALADVGDRSTGAKAKSIAALVHKDPPYPSVEAAYVAEGRAGAPGALKRVMDCVLSVGWVAQDHRGESVVLEEARLDELHEREFPRIGGCGFRLHGRTVGPLIGHVYTDESVWANVHLFRAARSYNRALHAPRSAVSPAACVGKARAAKRYAFRSRPRAKRRTIAPVRSRRTDLVFRVHGRRSAITTALNVRRSTRLRARLAP